MWDLVTHVLIGIFIGWYLYPFTDGHNIRNKVNELLKNLMKSIIDTMQKNKKEEPKATRKKATAKPKVEKVESTAKACGKCGSGLMPLGGEFKGFQFCPNCKLMVG